MRVELFFKEWQKYTVVHHAVIENQTSVPAKGSHVEYGNPNDPADWDKGTVEELQWDYHTNPPTVKVIIRSGYFETQKL